MSGFEDGDRVRVKEHRGWDGYEDGREAIVEYTFCEYGDHRLCLKFVDNGEVREMDEDMFEHVGDPLEARGLYEYNLWVPWSARDDGILYNQWDTKDLIEDMYLRMLEYRLTDAVDDVKIVRRLKAGPIEYV